MNHDRTDEGCSYKNNKTAPKVSRANMKKYDEFMRYKSYIGTADIE